MTTEDVKKNKKHPISTINVVLTVLVAVVLLHIGILLKILPYDITWGGRLRNDVEMYFFETISIVLNLFLICMVLIKAAYISAYVPMRMVNIILWIFILLFGLNTFGNLFAETTLERMFALLTFVVCLLLIKLQIKGPDQSLQKPH